MRDPRQFSASLGALTVGLVAAALTACSDGTTGGRTGSGGAPASTATGGNTTGGGDATGSGDVAGSGGSMATGGSSDSGGIAGTGGATSTGGVTSKGGVTSAGGVTSTGGVTSKGGVTSTGGATSTGGVTSTGGATSTGGSSAGGGSNETGGSMPDGGNSGSGGVAGTGGVASTGGAEGGSAESGGASSGGNAGTGGTTNTCPPATPLTGGTRYCSNSKGDAGHGYSYELWASEGGEGCMTVYGADANFSATWSNVDDFLARVGLEFDRTKTPDQIGNISAEFAETKTGDTGLVYVGIYGWTVDPLREYYILDDWGSTQPAGVASDGTPRTHAGTIIVDGDTYEVWTHAQVNKPAITGDNKTFDQYFSVRQTARQCGHISISTHFSEWAGLGLQLGDLVEAKILVEAQDGSGTIDFTTASVVVE